MYFAAIFDSVCVYVSSRFENFLILGIVDIVNYLKTI